MTENGRGDASLRPFFMPPVDLWSAITGLARGNSLSLTSYLTRGPTAMNAVSEHASDQTPVRDTVQP